MFWGLVIEPNKKYLHTVSNPFHVSQAVLDVKSTSDNTNVQLILTNEGVDYILCILKKSQTVQVPLDLMFSKGDELSFLSVGGTVHLTGYLLDKMNMDETESDVEERIPTRVPVSDSSKSTQPKKSEIVAQESNSDEDNSAESHSEDGSVEEDDDEGNDGDYDEEEEQSEDEEQGGEEEHSEGKEQSEGEEQSEEFEEKPVVKKHKLSNSSAKVSTKEGIKKAKKDKAQKPENTEKKPKISILQGGVKIEDIRVGKGPEAKPGKKVQVYYEGRLKANNKVFDKANSGEGFEFHVGRGEVIKGVDIGVSGMRVGSKRRITCPPNMAYGLKGHPPFIPANSTLVFDVKLRGVC